MAGHDNEPGPMNGDDSTAAGVPASDIAAQLGHRDGGSLALRVYVHPMAEGLHRAGAVLGQVIGGDP
jgi:hypothetical protein